MPKKILPETENLRRLNNIVQTLSTGLRTVAMIELQWCIDTSATQLTEEILNRGRDSEYIKPKKKKIEAVKKILDYFASKGIAMLEKNKFGNASFVSPRDTYNISDSSKEYIPIAYHLLATAIMAQKPVHEVYCLEGGSYSPDLKHIKKGILLACMYGFPATEIENNLDSPIWGSKPEARTSFELGDLFMISRKQVKNYITNLVNMGLIVKSEAIAKGNLREYVISDEAFALVKDSFIPMLGYINTGDMPPALAESCSRYNSDCKAYEDDARTVVDMHFSSIRNQFNNEKK